ncbi:MAG: hypothetical protein LC777_08815 [Actinobacteria bacterium]|nr:hypothetical protein [Actinomycetota bacterium]
MPGSDAAGKVSPRAPRLGVRGVLGDLRDIAKLVGLAQLAFRIGRASGSYKEIRRSGDLLACDALFDLAGDLLAAIGKLVELRRRAQLGLRAAPARLEPGRRGGRRRASVTERFSSIPVCCVSASTSAFPRPSGGGSSWRSRPTRRPINASGRVPASY